MTRRNHAALLALFVLSALVACAALPSTARLPPMSDDGDERDGGRDTEPPDMLPPDADVEVVDMGLPDPGPRTFTLTVHNDDLLVERGGEVTIVVEIHRTGGFAEPVLVELPGLPDSLLSQARESRPGDRTTELVIRAFRGGETLERAPFVVQASTLDGLRHTWPAHVTVR